MDDAEHAREFCRDQRRQRRITAKADDGDRLQSLDQAVGAQRPGRERQASIGELQRIASARSLARDDVDHVLREQAAVAQRALVRNEADAEAAPDQLDAERLSWKQMAAGAARGEKNQGGGVHDEEFYSVSP